MNQALDLEEFGGVEGVQRILWGDNPDFESIQETIEDQRRWSTTFSEIVRRKSDNAYFDITYERGSTEMQDVDFEPEVYRVYPRETTVIVYDYAEQ